VAAKHSALVDACVGYIHARGGMATKLQAGRVRVGGRWVHMSKSGWPDIVAVWPEFSWARLAELGDKSKALTTGRFLGIEVKTGKDTLSPVQRATHEELTRRGAMVLVVRDVQDLEAALA
jgi:hypothetical protein